MTKEVLYSDIDLSFTPHPVTGNVKVLKNTDAIKQAVKILVMTNKYDKIFNAICFSDVPYSLFENMDSSDLLILKNNIINTIDLFEPRATIVDVKVKDDLDLNGYTLTIIFIPQNATEYVTIDIFLERLR